MKERFIDDSGFTGLGLFAAFFIAWLVSMAVPLLLGFAFGWISIEWCFIA